MYECKICPHKVKCEEANGKERLDGDDYRALCGTHLCLWSWSDNFGKTDTQQPITDCEDDKSSPSKSCQTCGGIGGAEIANTGWEDCPDCG